MIALIRGTVAALAQDHVVVDTGGVGYRVFVPDPLLADLVLEQEVRLHVSTQVREDAILLYGFASPADRDTFVLLLSIVGIGARTALSALSTLDRRDLATAVARGDAGAFQRIPGVGKKLAQRLVVELAGKIIPDADPLPLTTPATPARPGDPLPLALAKLGYRKSEIDRALASVPGGVETPLEERIKQALLVLTSSR